MMIGHLNAVKATQTMARKQKLAGAPVRSTYVNQTSARLLRVLVIDDDCDTTDTLSTVVRLWGHNVRSAYDAAMGLLLALDNRPDVLLLDVAMPTITGLEFAQHLRRYCQFDRTLIIGMSGYADEANRVRCRQAGFDDFLAKPLELSKLEDLLMAERDRLQSPPMPASLVGRYTTAEFLGDIESARLTMVRPLHSNASVETWTERHLVP